MTIFDYLRKQLNLFLANLILLGSMQSLYLVGNCHQFIYHLSIMKWRRHVIYANKK